MRKLFTIFLLFITALNGVFAQINYPIYPNYSYTNHVNFSINYDLISYNPFSKTVDLVGIRLQGGSPYQPSNGYFTITGDFYTYSDTLLNYESIVSNAQLYSFTNGDINLGLSVIASGFGAFKLHYIEIDPNNGKHYRMCSSQWIFNKHVIDKLLSPGKIAGNDTLCNNSLISKITSVSPAGNNSTYDGIAITSYNGIDFSNFTFVGYEWASDPRNNLEFDYGTITTSSNDVVNSRLAIWDYVDINKNINSRCVLRSNSVTKTVMNCAVFSPNTIGATTIVPNQTTSYSVAGQTGMRYAWTVTGGTILSGQGTNSISVLWDGSGLSQARVAGNSYTVSVVETNANNVSNTLSSAITLTTTGTTSALQAAGISVFPNPCQNQVYVSMPESNVEVEYTIYSLRGEAVASGRFVSSVTSNVISNQLSAGMYQLVLSYKGQRVQTALSVTE